MHECGHVLTLVLTSGFRSALKKQARNAAMVVELPPVKSSADLVVFFSEVFQTPLRSLPLVAGLFAERGVSDAVPSEAVVRAFVDDVVSKLGLGLGSGARGRCVPFCLLYSRHACSHGCARQEAL